MNDASPEAIMDMLGGRTEMLRLFGETDDDPGYLASLDADAAEHSRRHAAGKSQRSQEQPVALDIVNPADLAFVTVPPLEWIVEDWLPVGSVTALYGDGGVGKSLLAQQLMTAAALDGIPWCGRQVVPCRSFALFCEDSKKELHRRQSNICAAFQINIADLGAMRWVSGVGRDNCLLTFYPEGKSVTPLYEVIREGAADHRARLVILDTAADTFSGNENDRHQVRSFIGQLTALAIEINGAVLLNAHPSRAGMASGNLDGGNTAWSNSVRSRWSLARPASADNAEPDADVRILTRRKANYSRAGEEIALRWVNGVLLPNNATIDTLGIPNRAAAETVFLDLLTRRRAANVFVSHNKRAGNYAPKMFAKMADRKGYTEKDFAAAMSRLLDTNRIIAESYGRSGDIRQRIAIVPEVAAP